MTESNERSHELDRLHAQVQAMKAKVEQHGEQVDKAGERLDQAQANLDKAGKRIDQAQANLDELARQIEAGQRRMMEGAETNKRRLRSQLTSAAFITVGCSFGVLSTDRPVLQALWLLTAVGWAVVGGHVLAALSIVAKQAEIAELLGEAYDPDERGSGSRNSMRGSPTILGSGRVVPRS